MARRKKRRNKAVKFSLIEPGKDVPEYRLLKEIIMAHHGHLERARIALAWRLDVKPNRDGLIELGKAKKASDLDRELKDYDFVILLNSTAWAGFGVNQRRALLDHELCHCQVSRGKDGEVQRDERGRPCYRMRKHDIEEFREVVQRHGCYKADLEEFARTLVERYQTPLFAGTTSDGTRVSLTGDATGSEPSANGHAEADPPGAFDLPADVEDTPLTKIDMPPVARSRLKRAGIETVGQLRALAGEGIELVDALAQLRGIGPDSARAIVEACEAWEQQQAIADAEG